jgi:hypothetical protein
MCITLTVKRSIYILSLFLFLLISACSKEEEINILEELPHWAYRQVEELTAKGESCKYITVALYEVNGKIYYNIEYSYSSCGMCNLFDEKGNRVSQSEKSSWSEFKMIDILPACK